MDILKPLGLAPEDVKLPLSPRSEDAYARINEEFDMLYSQLQDPGEQAGQNHAEVCRLCAVFSRHVSPVLSLCFRQALRVLGLCGHLRCCCSGTVGSFQG